jgi:cytochrome c553
VDNGRGRRRLHQPYNQEKSMNLASKTLVLALFVAGGSFAVPVVAAETAAIRDLAATCFPCHGTYGHSVGGVPPGLAGQNKNYLLRQMRDFKAGNRPATIMHQIARGYTDEQLDLITGYFASINPGPSTPAPLAGY